MRLKNDKIVSIVNFIQFIWNKKKFHIIINCKMINMKNDFILIENFWENYRLCFDYDTLDCKINNKKIKHLFHDMNFDRSRFQMFNNEFSKITSMSRRAFEKFIRKNAKCYFYVIRDVKSKKIEIVKIFEKFVSIQNIIEYLNLNKKLNFDVLFTFKNDFSNKSFSKRSQNYKIETNDVKFVNKLSYEFFKKQFDEQTIQIDYFMKKNFIRLNISFWNVFVFFAKKKWHLKNVYKL